MSSDVIPIEVWSLKSKLGYEGMYPDGNAPSHRGCKPRILLLNYGYAHYFFPHFKPRFALGFFSFEDFFESDFSFFDTTGSSVAFTDRATNWLPWMVPHTVHFNCPFLISLATRFPTPYISSCAACLHVHLVIFVVMICLNAGARRFERPTP